ncbi:MAG TPA: SiaB family protein kinase [Alphaproteobacteria bacterium]|nr:SiaB family protein kinase [Alphaproteobacteria bacterium]
MQANELLDMRKALADKQGLFFYSGYVSEKFLTGMGDVLRRRLDASPASLVQARNLFAVFVEHVQNIIRYSAENLSAAEDGDDDVRYGVIVIGTEAERFFITCGNLVHHRHVERLRARLEKIQGMDKDALKVHYKEQMKAPPEEASKGAGLGLIDIARRASQPIQFDFAPYSDDYAFFSLKTVV